MGEIALLAYSEVVLFGFDDDPADDEFIAASVTGDLEALKERAQVDANARCDVPTTLTWSPPNKPGDAHVSSNVQPAADRAASYFYYIQPGIPLVDSIVSAAEVRSMIDEAVEMIKADRG
jgi:hypothetical protein